METIKQPFLIRNSNGEIFFACFKSSYKEQFQRVRFHKEVAIVAERAKGKTLIALKSDIYDLPKSDFIAEQEGIFEISQPNGQWRKVQLVQDYAKSKGLTPQAVRAPTSKYPFVPIENKGTAFVFVPFPKFELKVKKSRPMF